MNSNQSHVVVVGGGLAGLSAATLLALGGAKVTLLERSTHLGGRAWTTLQGEVSFNLGPHALYLTPCTTSVLQRCGGLPAGGTPTGEGVASWRKGGAEPVLEELPSTPMATLRTRLLSLGQKLELGKLFGLIRFTNVDKLHTVSAASWLRDHVRDPELRELMGAFMRLSTYCDELERLSVAVPILALRAAMAGQLRYVDGGWAAMVGGLESAARRAGVDIRANARVHSIERGSGMRLADETIHADALLLAVPPKALTQLLPNSTIAARLYRDTVPIEAACLDLALDQLPIEGRDFALGIDAPLYLSNHSAAARLAPEGVAVVHAALYLSSRHQPEDPRDQLEAWLDQIQPGWRAHLADERFLPRITVCNAIPEANRGGLPGRPGVDALADEHPSVFLAGDWIGPQGQLADASFSSADAASRAILAQLRQNLPTQRAAS